MTDRAVMPRTESENLDSKSIAFSMFVSCKGATTRHIIERSNGSFWLDGFRKQWTTVAVLKLSKVIWQQNQQAGRFGFEDGTTGRR